ncbi:MAG: YbjN domain-containing protein [Pontixanthobacter sp.]
MQPVDPRAMMLRDAPYTLDENAAPVDMLAALFEARGWPFTATSADELSGEIQGSWTNYQLRAVWRGDDNVLQLLCLPEVRVGKDRRASTCELLALINEQMWLGHFDIWSKGDLLVYRNAALLGNDGLLSLDQAQAIVETAVEECDRFYPAFQFVLWGDKSPHDALDSALIDAAGEA